MKSKLEEQFIDWVEKNPHLVTLFFKFADQAWEANPGKPIGAHHIVSRIRWETVVVSKEADFKINNNFSAYLARLYVKEKPERIKLFRFRQTKGELLREATKKATPMCSNCNDTGDGGPVGKCPNCEPCPYCSWRMTSTPNKNCPKCGGLGRRVRKR